FLQLLYKKVLAEVELRGFIIPESILVAVFSGQQRGARWATDGIIDKGIFEYCPLISDAVYLWRFPICRSIGSNRLIGMVIRDNNDDIWPFLCRSVLE